VYFLKQLKRATVPPHAKHLLQDGGDNYTLVTN